MHSVQARWDFYLQPKSKYDCNNGLMVLWGFFCCCYLCRILSLSIEYLITYAHRQFMNVHFFLLFSSLLVASNISNTIVNVWWNSPSKSHVRTFIHIWQHVVGFNCAILFAISLNDENGTSNSSTTHNTLSCHSLIPLNTILVHTHICIQTVTDGLVCMPTFINVMIHRFLSWIHILIIIVFVYGKRTRSHVWLYRVE